MPDLPDRLAEALKDRYTLQRELGRGGMATVYLATDLKHERSVALKVLNPELAAVLAHTPPCRQAKQCPQPRREGIGKPLVCPDRGRSQIPSKLIGEAAACCG